MAIRYPKGSLQYVNSSSKRKTKRPIEYGHRGMKFEEMINQSNDYYLNRHIAVIHKKPTPIQIVNVDYPKRSAAKITEAYFTQASTTDYNGVVHHCYIDFEAKETKNKTSFPLSNFHQHQIDHMAACTEQGGICFVLLWFSSLNRCFYLDFAILNDYWQHQETRRKSIPLNVIEQEGVECPIGIAPVIDYIQPVLKQIEKQNNR